MQRLPKTSAESPQPQMGGHTPNPLQEDWGKVKMRGHWPGGEQVPHGPRGRIGSASGEGLRPISQINIHCACHVFPTNDFYKKGTTW